MEVFDASASSFPNTKRKSPGGQFQGASKVGVVSDVLGLALVNQIQFVGRRELHQHPFRIVGAAIVRHNHLQVPVGLRFD